MIDLVAIDPGEECPGVAAFAAGQLVRAYCSPGDDRGWILPVHRALRGLEPRRFSLRVKLVVERPQVYQTGKRKGNPNSLIDVAAVAGGIVCQLVERASWVTFTVEEVEPHTWKGHLSKEETKARVRERLHPDEVAHVELPTTRGGRVLRAEHNVWDAVGIGLFSLRRFGVGTKPAMGITDLR